MGAGEALFEIEPTIQRAVISLSQTVADFLQKGVELTRICRLAMLLAESGVSLNPVVYHGIAEKCVAGQRDDGGWSDVPETAWCAGLLQASGKYGTPAARAIQWLRSQSPDGRGWGRSSRDRARIPITGQILYFLPRLASGACLEWLAGEWDREYRSEPCLSYKAAFALMAFERCQYQPEDRELIPGTVRWLADQQNDDGGWGPWRGHPVGSDPWCTGICLIALLHYADKLPQRVLRAALAWLEKKQLPSGFWAYHYLDDGSAWALLALAKGYTEWSRRKDA